MVDNKTESPESIRKVVGEVSRIVSEMAGIQLGEKQQSMVESRLKTRMLRMGINSFQEYLSYLTKNKESESQALLSLMTTHHTYFFREFAQFEFLLNKALPEIVEAAKKRADKTIRIWSAASSRGQEVYSLAMFFNFHLPQFAKDLKYEIWGTDIDPESVKIAKNGVYRMEEVNQCPAIYVGNNWIRGQGSVSEFMKIRDFLKQRCNFTTANLLDSDGFLKGREFDVVFCRNVFIYFNHSSSAIFTQC